MDETAKRVRVTGRVQGVGFRAFTQVRAARLGLRGWVRNEVDGSVAVLVAGPEAQVERLLAELRQGPAGAAVVGVTVEAADPVSLARFEIRG